MIAKEALRRVRASAPPARLRASVGAGPRHACTSTEGDAGRVGNGARHASTGDGAGAPRGRARRARTSLQHLARRRDADAPLRRRRRRHARRDRRHAEDRSRAARCSPSTPSASAAASNHRLGLDDGILIKNTHVALGGGEPGEAVRRVRAAAPGAAAPGRVPGARRARRGARRRPDVVLLDNMTPDERRPRSHASRDACRSRPRAASRSTTSPAYRRDAAPTASRSAPSRTRRRRSTCTSASSRSGDRRGRRSTTGS